MISSPLRITGMASGLDVDGMVKKLMQAENMRVDKVKQQRQILQWTQDSYRDSIGDMNTFKSTYFDFTKPDTNMLSANAYTGLDATQDITGSVNVNPSVGAASGNYSVKVDSLAAGASLGDTTTVDNRNNKSSVLNLSNWDGSTTAKTITFSVDGVNKSITLNKKYSSNQDLVTDINSKLSDTNSGLSGKISVSLNGNNLQFNTLSSNTIKIVDDGGITDLDSIVKTNNGVMNPTSSTKLSDILGGSTTGVLNINYSSSTTPVSIDLSTVSSIGDLVSAINNKGAGGVTASFSELTGKLNIQTVSMGSSSSVNYSIAGGSNNDLTKLGLVAQNTSENGADAILEITPPGSSTTTTVVKNTNNFTIDNVNYSLVKTTASNTSFSLNVNTQKVFDKIKGFIDKYNDMISKLNQKIDEKKQYSYAPLTDDQKSSMKDTEITAWEAKAKQGLLKNDSSIGTMLSSLRNAFYDNVSAAGLTLTDIGLSTSPDVTQRGQIVYDQDKLKAAIQNNGDKVAKLFMNTASTDYDPNHAAYNAKDATSRYAQEGIFQRVNDILNDYTRTTRDNSNRKGLLLEKAGITGDFTEFNNMLSKQINEQDTLINDLNQKLSDKENNYYTQFSKLEQAMQQSNAQSAWLSQQFK